VESQWKNCVVNADAQKETVNVRNVKMYDTIIIGGGPAALAAAVYAARQKIKFLVVAKAIGGQVAWSSEVENYLGVKSSPGISLTNMFKEHVDSLGVKFLMDEVLDIERGGKLFIVKTRSKILQTKTILIASGKQPRMLKVPGEGVYMKKGVTYCATCDGPVFSGVNVAVIGGGNSALDAALLLEKYAKKVTLLTINNKLIGETSMINKVNKSSKIDVVYGAKTKEFKGDGKKLEWLVYEKDKDVKEINVNGAFIEIGSIPSTDFDRITRKNQWGEIMVFDKKEMSNLTSVPGIFAAGDVTSVIENQVIVAAGEGVKAILGIFKYLNNHN